MVVVLKINNSLFLKNNIGEIMSLFLEKVKKLFLGRPVGFYLNIGAAVLSIFVSIFYLINYFSNGISWLAFLLPIVGAIIFLVASFFGFEKYGSVAMWLLNLSGFTFYGMNIYMLFMDVFVNMQVNSSVIILFVCSGLYLLNWIFSFIASCLNVKNSSLI